MLEDQEMIAVAQGIIDTEIQGLEKLKKSIGRELIEAAKTIYESRGKLIITGIGKTGAIGRKIAATLSSTGTTTIFMNSTEGLHGDLGMVNPEDIVIGISNSGESDEILHIIRSEEHTSELQSRQYLVCRLLLEKKKKNTHARC